MAVVENVRASDLKLLLENAYSRTTDSDAGTGIAPVGSDARFAHVSGLLVKYDISRSGFLF